ncbi:MAG: hypothetical protein ACOCYT_01655, partial [Chloroflexota bacterium]
MFQRLQMLGRGQRLFIFIMIFGGGLALLIALTLLLLTFSLNTAPRAQGEPLVEGITVTEYVTLPDDDAYPAAVAVALDGTVYTGSYETGVVWEVDPDGRLRELPDTRELIGSVTGIDVGPDGVLYVLDRLVSNPRSQGGVLWRFRPGESPESFGAIDDEQGFVSPNDVVVAPDGTVYVTDRGRREVWRFDPDGTASLFWSLAEDDPDYENVLLTGLVYDADGDALLVTDSGLNSIYRITPDGAGERIYLHNPADALPVFDGLAIGPDDTLYIGALEAGVVAIRDGEFIPLAINFRGASDVAYNANRLFVTNFDSASLVNPLVNPQLPFALDVIELGEWP